MPTRLYISFLICLLHVLDNANGKSLLFSHLKKPFYKRYFSKLCCGAFWLAKICIGARQLHVTCGSVIKLLNTDFRVRLHSHDVKYGTGSGQQSVTGTEIQEDVNSHWVIKAATDKICPRGEAIRCGSIIRLEHLETKKNLHSHQFLSPMSGQQEISAYGDNGEGDSGDHWVVICSGIIFFLEFSSK